MSLLSPTFFLSMAFTILMGFAIQRGGTCTVAAIDELIVRRRTGRFMALMEAALWVFGGLLVLWSFHLVEQPLHSWKIATGTILGAFLLGLGAVINGACLVGTISRIGNLEWTFCLTLPGFLLGAWIFYGLNIHEYFPHEQSREARQLMPIWVAAVILIFMGWRIFHYRKHIWHPRMATIMIGISTLGLALVYGPWAFSDFFIDVAQSKAELDFLPRLLLFIGLLAGTIWGGTSSKTARPIHQMNVTGAVKRIAGGMLMGIGSIMIPGSHDSLILFYLPLFLPFAWLAFSIMIATIAALKYWMHLRSQSQ